MPLPIDLVLVRHGQSEGNMAIHKSEKGDDSAFTEAFTNRHSSSFRLTDVGRTQATLAGKWIYENLYKGDIGFDLHIVSPFLRAMETAGLLNLSNAQWLPESNLAERNWGVLDISPANKRKKDMKGFKLAPFFWCPPNGQSLLDVSLQINPVLRMLRKKYSKKRVLAVGHGDTIWTIRFYIEGMSQERFRTLYLSKDKNDRLYNCQIIHYSRRNPVTGSVGKHIKWLRMIRPTTDPVWDTGWQYLEPPRRLSNKELLALAEQTPRMIS